VKAEHAEDLHAELGYRTAGQREVRQREWFTLRGEADEPLPTPKAFARKIAVLRAVKWQRENPERRKVIANRYAQKPENAKHSIDLARERRQRAHREAAEVFTCATADCGAQFCLVPWAKRGGRPQRFCSGACQARHRYRELHPAAKPRPRRAA